MRFFHSNEYRKRAGEISQQFNRRGSLDLDEVKAVASLIPEANRVYSRIVILYAVLLLTFGFAVLPVAGFFSLHIPDWLRTSLVLALVGACIVHFLVANSIDQLDAITDKFRCESCSRSLYALEIISMSETGKCPRCDASIGDFFGINGDDESIPEQ